MPLSSTPQSTDVFADDLFSGERVLITGGGTGIGEHLALAFAEHGADVGIASRDMDHLEPVAEEIESRGVEACATTVDVRDKDKVDEMTATVVDELGGIDVLVNNAGANFLSPAEKLSANGWRAVVGTILDGTAYCTFSVGEHMIEEGDGGSIISMGATNSVQGAPYHAHSGAGKAGVHNLMMTVASEWARHGIRANTVAPGVILTEAIEEIIDESYKDVILEHVPADRLGQPEDCVPPVLFLASEAASYVTGAYYTVDGGQLVAPTPF
ncbi:MAG: SDR family oxidoreductase [Halobacteria archaeon]|nr:SDR family oxidoreductase [Halobacteria archaeon]